MTDSTNHSHLRALRDKIAGFKSYLPTFKAPPYVPTLRVLPEELVDDSSSSSSIDGHESVPHKAKTDDISVEAVEHETQLTQTLQPGIPYELRDEKGRKWWKYFDEFEYRANSEYKKTRRWYSFLYPNHTTHSKAERRLLYKLDLMIGLYFLVLCWCKSLDTNNYSNAYFAGMEKDLKMTKNDYINTTAISNVGAIVLQLPFMYFLPRFPAHYILPFMDLGWSMFTLACYRAQSLPELRAYRFFVSAFGSAYYPVSQYVLGSWYAPDEISSRVCLFFCGQLLGGITSGLLQASTFKHLNGVRGLAGWRWMFLIDAVAISIPCAVIGFFVIPGVPSKCYSLFLTDEEIRVARARNKRNQIHDKVDKEKLLSLFSLKIWKKVFFNPVFWVLVVFDTCSWNNMTAFSGSFLFWLRNDHKFSVVQIQNLSVLPACLGFVFVFICACGADLFRCKWVFMVMSQIMNCISCAILIKWDVPVGAKWFAFLITYFSVAASPCLWSFINDFLRMDPQLRAVTWIAIYSFSQSTYAWIPTLTWKTVEQPRFKTGYTASLIFSAVYGLWTFVVLYFYKRCEKKNALRNGIILFNSDNGETAPAFVESQMEQKGEYFFVKDSEKENL